MNTTNYLRKEAHCCKNAFSYEGSHSSTNKICCPYFNYCFNIYNQMYYRSVKTGRTYNEKADNNRNFIKTNREYDNQINEIPDFEQEEDLIPTSPNIYKFKNNFNIYLKKTKLHV